MCLPTGYHPYSPTSVLALLSLSISIARSIPHPYNYLFNLEHRFGHWLTNCIVQTQANPQLFDAPQCTVTLSVDSKIWSCQMIEVYG